MIMKSRKSRETKRCKSPTFNRGKKKRGWDPQTGITDGRHHLKPKETKASTRTLILTEKTAQKGEVSKGKCEKEVLSESWRGRRARGQNLGVSACSRHQTSVSSLPPQKSATNRAEHADYRLYRPEQKEKKKLNYSGRRTAY